MKNSFNIKDVIERFHLDPKDVEDALFPDLLHRHLAFKRVEKGEMELNTSQLEALAKLAGVFVRDLFTISGWKGATENGYLVMRRGDFQVKLNCNGTFLTLIKGPRIVKQEVVCPKDWTLEEFLEHLDQITIL